MPRPRKDAPCNGQTAGSHSRGLPTSRPSCSSREVSAAGDGDVFFISDNRHRMPAVGIDGTHSDMSPARAMVQRGSGVVFSQMAINFLFINNYGLVKNFCWRLVLGARLSAPLYSYLLLFIRFTGGLLPLSIPRIRLPGHTVRISADMKKIGRVAGGSKYLRNEH